MRIHAVTVSAARCDWISAADACRRRRHSGGGWRSATTLRPVGSSSGRSDSSSDTTASPTGARLFSNLNPETLRHEPGTVLGAAALVAGTTVGAGILALPAVTQASGFAASSAALTACCLFNIITGLLVAEVNINTLCEIGAGRGVSLR